MTIPFDHGEDVPVNPFRTRLYTSAELLGEFDTAKPASYTETIDFDTYRSYVMNGRADAVPYMQSIVRALHDNSISQAINRFKQDKKIVGIMGGHRLSRASQIYRDIVLLAKRLSEGGYTVASGGGPGAMEASHVGAHLAGRPDTAIDEAIAVLAAVPELPENLGGIVADDGAVDDDVVAALHTWQAPAFAVARDGEPGAASLAIPTWHYGHEPPTPLASHIAKYFQNSIREDGLLAIATYGVVFAEGRAGTIQEIFQDATQNYYRSFEWFSPMVLFGEETWTTTYPVVDVLRGLFSDDDQDCLSVTDDIDVVIATIINWVPPAVSPRY